MIRSLKKGGLFAVKVHPLNPQYQTDARTTPVCGSPSDMPPSLQPPPPSGRRRRRRLLKVRPRVFKPLRVKLPKYVVHKMLINPKPYRALTGACQPFKGLGIME